MAAIREVMVFNKSDLFPCEGNGTKFIKHIVLFNNNNQCADNDAADFVTYDKVSNIVNYGTTETFATFNVDNNTDINFTNFYLGILSEIDNSEESTNHIVYRIINLYPCKKLAENKYKFRLPKNYTGVQDPLNGGCIFFILMETEDQYPIEDPICGIYFEFPQATRGEGSGIPLPPIIGVPIPEQSDTTDSNLIIACESEYFSPLYFPESAFKQQLPKDLTFTLSFDNIYDNSEEE